MADDPAETALHGGAPGELFALVRGKRSARSRRFPAGCVTPLASAEEALERAVPGRNLHAARLFGPSPSSEGVRVYYLVHWL